MSFLMDREVGLSPGIEVWNPGVSPPKFVPAIKTSTSTVNVADPFTGSSGYRETIVAVAITAIKYSLVFGLEICEHEVYIKVMTLGGKDLKMGSKYLNANVNVRKPVGQIECVLHRA